MVPVDLGPDLLALEIGALETIGDLKAFDGLACTPDPSQVVTVHVVRMRNFRCSGGILRTVAERIIDAPCEFVRVDQEVIGSEMRGTLRQDVFVEGDR